MEKLLLKKLSFSLLLAVTSLSVSAQNRFWSRLVPDQVQLQYAGSIGFLSAGAGYDLFHEKAELSAHLGYVPESLGGELTIVALKFHYKPFTFPIGKRIIVQPFNPVFFTSYTLGQNFDFKFENQNTKKATIFGHRHFACTLGQAQKLNY